MHEDCKADKGAGWVIILVLRIEFMNKIVLELQAKLNELEAERIRIMDEREAIPDKMYVLEEEIFQKTKYTRLCGAEEVNVVNNEIAQMEHELRALEKKYEDLEERVSDLWWQCDQLEDEKYELECAENSEMLLSGIMELNDANTMRAKLTAETLTTPIIGDFLKSDKRFLVLEKVFALSSVPQKEISLVLVRKPEKVRYKSNDLTMTELKLATGTRVNDYLLRYISEKNRRYHLYVELVEIGNKSPMVGEIVPFQTPCYIRGQDSRKQYGFSWEKPYGLTNAFLIIGAIIEN